MPAFTHLGFVSHICSHTILLNAKCVFLDDEMCFPLCLATGPLARLGCIYKGSWPTAALLSKGL